MGGQSFCVWSYLPRARDRRRTCKQPIATRFPRLLASAWFSPGRPHCLRWIGYHSDCDWTGCCLSAACRREVPAVLPQVLLPKRNRPLAPFGSGERKVFAVGICSFQNTRDGSKKAPHFSMVKSEGFDSLFFDYFFIFSKILCLRAWITSCETPYSAVTSRVKIFLKILSFSVQIRPPQYIVIMGGSTRPKKRPNLPPNSTVERR